MSDNRPIISLVPLQEDDKEQFILDNQWAFRYGAQIEFGMRDDRAEEGVFDRICIGEPHLHRRR